jgi:hypothetical protein
MKKDAPVKGYLPAGTGGTLLTRIALPVLYSVYYIEK